MNIWRADAGGGNLKQLTTGTDDQPAWYGREQLGAMFAKSDSPWAMLPEIPTTVGLIGASELAALPRDAWLVNVGRGPVLDEPALIQTLREGRIAGAYSMSLRPRTPACRESLLGPAECSRHAAHCLVDDAPVAAFGRRPDRKPASRSGRRATRQRDRQTIPVLTGVPGGRSCP